MPHVDLIIDGPRRSHTVRATYDRPPGPGRSPELRRVLLVGPSGETRQLPIRTRFRLEWIAQDAVTEDWQETLEGWRDELADERLEDREED